MCCQRWVQWHPIWWKNNHIATLSECNQVHWNSMVGLLHGICLDGDVIRLVYSWHKHGASVWPELFTVRNFATCPHFCPAKIIGYTVALVLERIITNNNTELTFIDYYHWKMQWNNSYISSYWWRWIELVYWYWHHWWIHDSRTCLRLTAGQRVSLVEQRREIVDRLAARIWMHLEC